ncbi:hypothetical protein AX16_001181 [Volvariella volvacea WC 439]|nr:hypothetical protein AX16_001181 [Volvariella volvacea WC 439]
MVLRSPAARKPLRQVSIHAAPRGGSTGMRTRTLLTLSAVSGPTEPPLSTHTLPSYWSSEILSRHSARPALVARQEKPRAHGGPARELRNMGRDKHLAWDFEEFDRHVQALARGLVGLGVEKGDRVGVIMGNTSAYGMLQWACASIGAILVTINPAYRLNELVGTLNLVGVKHLFLVPSIRSSHYLQLLSQSYPDLTHSSPGNIQEPALPTLRNLVVIDNEGEFVKSGMKDKLEFKSGIEWKEVMVWRDGEGSEERKARELRGGLKNDEVVNLQFTR